MSDVSNRSQETTFDWVTARHKCSLYKMFIELRNGVHEDIEKRREIRQPNEQVAFEMGGGSARRFSVFRTSHAGSRCVDFQFTDASIEVSEQDKTILKATITLNNKGRCNFIVNGQELEMWQVRRMALEELFFG